MGAAVRWWAKGLLFENCSCTSICPGHVHFKQACTHERCVGYWAIRFDEGEFDGESLAGTSAVIAYDSPQHMIEGEWIETIIIDEGASETQRQAIETILTGAAGGPWEVLGRFVGRRETTRHLPILIRDDGKTKHLAVDGLLESTIEDIRGRDRSEPVTLENIFNQIHATSQVIAAGGTRYDDGVISIEIDGTHALHSHFDWSVEP